MHLHAASTVAGCRVVEYLEHRRRRVDEGRVAFGGSAAIQICEVVRDALEVAVRRVPGRQPGELRQPSAAHVMLEKLRGEAVGPGIQADPSRPRAVSVEKIKDTVGMRLGWVEVAGGVAFD